MNETPEDKVAASRRIALIREARLEVNLRILIQNLIVILNTGQIMIWMAAVIFSDAGIFLIWFAAATTSVMLGFTWIHSGVRHAQYRQYFKDILDPASEHVVIGWEAALKKLRPHSALGSRWWISTKGVFAFGHC